MIKNHTTGRDCQAVRLPIRSHNREKERQRKGGGQKKEREIQFSCSEGRSVLEMGISS